jgi:uncharacterized protein YcaQ
VVAERIALRPVRSAVNLTGLPTSHIRAFGTGYIPAPKRKYGYFTLPILYNNALIGRIDPKAHRKEGVFEVKALHLEPGVIVDDILLTEVKAALRACARFAKQIVAQDAAGRGALCHRTGTR